MNRPLLNRALAGLGTTIFAEMSELAVATGSVNLGQGFPDTDGPAEIARAAADAILAGRGNQYPPGAGIAELRRAIADHQRRFYGLAADPDGEVQVRPADPAAQHPNKQLAVTGLRNQPVNVAERPGGHRSRLVDNPCPHEINNRRAPRADRRRGCGRPAARWRWPRRRGCGPAGGEGRV